MTGKLTEADLSVHTGTGGYHSWSMLFRRHVLTDGTKMVAEKGGAYWLMDAIASYHLKCMRHVRLCDIQFWRMTTKKKSGILECFVDYGESAVIRQKIEYTDFPLAEIEIWVEGGGPDNMFVLMLPNER